MPGLPAIRGFVCKTILDAARSLPEDQQRRIFMDIPPATLALLESTPRLGWVPMPESMWLTDALHRTLGNPGFRHFFSLLAEHLVSAPLLQSLFDGAVRLLGLTPQAMLKWSTYAWEQAFRDCGRLIYRPIRDTPSQGRVEMILEDFPPLLHRGGTFAEALAATFEMFLRRVSKKGRVELRPMQPHTNRLVCDVSWE
ncbi:hypothetical protein [Cystobacter fuscus]|uniref:hypothetical protein n=1 Tax=Cystobacter fuscus TaxID=43 RepID=UPI002B325E1A|nr:hypothetical protein F0U63_37180 [Cystobacter fuscus]